MPLKKHKPTIEDRIQERIDLQKVLKCELKNLVAVIEWIGENEKEIKKLKKLENNKKKKKLI
jgi:hypothetical protein